MAMLTDQESAEFCAIMRIVSFYRSNTELFRDEPQIMSAFNGLQDSTAELLEILGEQERDALLERYRDELEFVEFQAGKTPVAEPRPACNL